MWSEGISIPLASFPSARRGHVAPGGLGCELYKLSHFTGRPAALQGRAGTIRRPPGKVRPGQAYISMGAGLSSWYDARVLLFKECTPSVPGCPPHPAPRCQSERSPCYVRRRLFLRHSALAALGLTVPGWPGWAVQDQKPDEKKEDKEAAKRITPEGQKAIDAGL